MKYIIKKDFLRDFAYYLFLNSGWSKFYEKIVIVEPICFFDIKRNILAECKSIESVVYKKDSLKDEVIKVIDEEASEHLEQLLVMGKNYILVCDDSTGNLPIGNRIKGLLKELNLQRDLVNQVNGIIHYHINEPCHSSADIEVMHSFVQKIKCVDGSNQLSIVLSQQAPLKNMSTCKNFDEFWKYIEDEIRERKIELYGYLFDGNNHKSVDLVIGT